MIVKIIKKFLFQFKESILANNLFFFNKTYDKIVNIISNPMLGITRENSSKNCLIGDNKREIKLKS